VLLYDPDDGQWYLEGTVEGAPRTAKEVVETTDLALCEYLERAGDQLTAAEHTELQQVLTVVDTRRGMPADGR